MAEQFTISIRNADLKAEIELAASGTYPNPNELTNEALVVEQVSVFLADMLNKYRTKVAIDTAVSNVEQETTVS